jgi:hypothetical protein
MTDRRRFLHLERARPTQPGAPAPQPSGVSAGRFAGVEGSRPDAPGPAASPTGAHLERFGAEREASLELADTDARRPFTRCARCGADSNAFLTACGACGASFATAEQQAFDERFWAERTAQAEAEASAAAERAAGRARAEADEAAARRAMGEAMAREIGEAERRRLGGGFGSSDGLGGGLFDSTPMGLRLLRALPGPAWQWGTAAALAVVIGGLVLHGLLTARRGPTLPLGLGLFMLLVVPWGAGRSRWRRWW